MRFCEYIEQRMKELHMKPIDLATLTGFDKSYISVILHGKQNPTKEETIQTLARVLRLKNWMWLLVYAIRDKDPSVAKVFKVRMLLQEGRPDAKRGFT